MTKKKIKVVVQPQKKKTKNKKEQEITAIGKALRSLGGLGGSALGGMALHPYFSGRFRCVAISQVLPKF